MTTRAILWSALAMGLMLAACSDNTRTDTEAGSEIVLRRGNSAEPRSLDPHHVQGDWESNLVGDMLMGLTVDGPDGVSVPGAAERWEVSDDGLIWTFYLRAHNWSDGTPVTADDFVYAWRRIADPETAAEYASLLYGFKNLRAINAGEMPKETLGVRAIDAATLELELEAPAPYLVELLSNFTAYPLPRHVVEVHGGGWTQAGIYVGNGPFTLAEWIPNDHITLVKNEGFYDAQNVAIDRVIYYPISDREAALRRFRAGELDTQDQLPPQQIDWLRENMPEVLRIEPFLGVEYFTVNHARAPFGDVRVREALNLALNREAITEQIIRLGNPPAYGVVPPGIANYPGGNAFSFVAMPHAERIERAQMLMREAGYGPDNPLETTLTVRSTAPDARRV
ncbi:MAG: peptide ABC transporter substrate-binding protein, partial [Proteobacteria bacterium]|nr:peptide ABC transporter substrate-binding protein [Pseudomonadota bacterium]